MISKQVGVILCLIMVATLAAPLAVAFMMMAGKLSLIAGLLGGLLAGLLVYMSAQSFLTVWCSTPGFSEEKPPEMAGTRLFTAVGYSIVMVLIGYVIEVTGSG
ncbi:MAG: hypothetical protein IMY80_00120 [Chloroflexi bacterium]|nr:hypothetical protein [Chloroflexota bacterium]